MRLVAGGSEADDEAIQRALVFVSRCQNLKGPGNDTKFGPLVNDGGFYYTIPGESEDTTGDRYTADGGLRSYGSMTYAGYKSLIYAGLTESDPRVKAAREWIEKHYTVADNPGQGDAGLYYYYHAFAAALAAAKLDAVQSRTANRTIGGTTWWPSWPSDRTTTDHGPTRTAAGWRTIRTCRRRSR